MYSEIGNYNTFFLHYKCFMNFNSVSEHYLYLHYDFTQLFYLLTFRISFQSSFSFEIKLKSRHTTVLFVCINNEHSSIEFRFFSTNFNFFQENIWFLYYPR